MVGGAQQGKGEEERFGVLVEALEEGVEGVDGDGLSLCALTV